MPLQLKPQTRGNLFLALFDFLVDELFDAPAARANDVVVVSAVIDLIRSAVVAKMVAHNEAGSLKLRQDAVDGGQTHFDFFGQQLGAVAFRPTLLSSFSESEYSRSFPLMGSSFSGSMQANNRYDNGKFLALPVLRRVSIRSNS